MTKGVEMSLVVLKAHCRLLLPLNLGAGAAADVLVLAVTCFFVAADYLAYSTALWVVRVNNGSVTASASDTSSANTQLHTFGAFDALYPGALGNSLEVAYVKGSRFEETLVEVGDISSSKLTGNTQIGQSIAFNATSTTFELLPADRITVANVEAGDTLVLGNDSVGYQEVSVVSITETGLDADGEETANVATLAAYSYNIVASWRPIVSTS